MGRGRGRGAVPFGPTGAGPLGGTNPPDPIGGRFGVNPLACTRRRPISEKNELSLLPKPSMATLSAAEPGTPRTPGTQDPPLACTRLPTAEIRRPS